MPHQQNRREWRPGYSGSQRKCQSHGRDSGRESYKPWLEVLEPPRSHSNPFGFAGMSNDHPLPLPSDHPLKEELAEVRHQMESRELYWAGLTQRIPEEMENLGSYDHQRWKEERKLADAKIEQLVTLIALAERGIPITRESSPSVGQAALVQPPSQLTPSDRGGNEAEAAERRNQPRPKKGVRRQRQEQYSQPQKGARAGDHRSPHRSIRQEGTMVWTEATRSEAFSKWMNELKPGFEDEDRPEVPLFISEDDRSIQFLNDDDIGSSDGILNAPSPATCGANVGGEAQQPSARVGTNMLDVWPARYEADFQEAEAERETQRYYMAFVMGIEKLGAYAAIQPQPVAEEAASHDPRLRRNPKKPLAKLLAPEIQISSKLIGLAQEVPCNEELVGIPVKYSKGTESQRSQQTHIPQSVEEIPIIQSVEVRAAEAVTNDAEAQKRDELLAALLEELSNSSWSSGPEDDWEPLRRPKAETELALEVDSAKPEAIELPEQASEEKKQPSLLSALPVPEVEPALPPIVFPFDERKMRIMAAMAFAGIQAKKRQMAASPQSSIHPNDGLVASIPASGDDLKVDEDAPRIKDVRTTQEDSGTYEISVERRRRHPRPIAADYMDIDIIKPIEVINMQDVLESRSENGESIEADIQHDDVSMESKQTEESGEKAPVPLIGRVLYVGNLSFEATEEDLQCLFDSYQVESIVIPRDPHMQRPPGYAFVIMSSASEAESAIADSWEFHINQRTVTVRLGNLPKQYAAQHELQRRVAEYTGCNLLRATRIIDNKGKQLTVSQPGVTKVSKKQKADELLSRPRYDTETVDAVERMLNNPGISLTDLKKGQRRIHCDYVTEQLAKISKYKVKRMEGQMLSVTQIKRINREDDVIRYGKELRRSLGLCDL